MMRMLMLVRMMDAASRLRQAGGRVSDRAAAATDLGTRVSQGRAQLQLLRSLVVMMMMMMGLLLLVVLLVLRVR